MEVKQKLPIAKKRCAHCGALVGVRTETCPQCGQKFVLKSRTRTNKEREPKMICESKAAMTPEEFRAAVRERLSQFGEVVETNHHIGFEDGSGASGLIHLGTWHDLEAWWGYSEEHDEDGLLLRDQGGEEVGFYSDGDLDRLLCRVGSMGCCYLVYSGKAWETIPALCGDFAKSYERWGC